MLRPRNHGLAVVLMRGASHEDLDVADRRADRGSLCTSGCAREASGSIEWVLSEQSCWGSWCSPLPPARRLNPISRGQPHAHWLNLEWLLVTSWVLTRSTQDSKRLPRCWPVETCLRSCPPVEESPRCVLLRLQALRGFAFQASRRCVRGALSRYLPR